MKKRFGSRAKGKVGEREVAKLVQPWWAQIEPGCEFAPTPLSGGWNKASMRGGMKMSGDLCTTAERFPFVIEVKRREKFNLINVLAGKRSPVFGWWRQCCDAAEEQGGQPLLVFRKNRGEWFYIMRPSATGFSQEIWPDNQQRIRTVDGEDVHIGRLSDLLGLDPRQFGR